MISLQNGERNRVPGSWKTLTFAVLIGLGCATSSRGILRGQQQLYDSLLKGFILERDADLSEAMAAYQQALSRDKESPYLHVRIGATYVKLGKSAEARAWFEKALELDPDNTEAIRWLGMLSTSEGRIGEATKVYERLSEVDPEDRFILSTLADLYVLQGKVEPALPLYRRLISLFGSNNQVHFNLGILAGRTGDYKEALSEFSRAIELDPYSVETRIGIGIIFELLERYRDAAAHYEAALKIDGENAQLYRNVARAYTSAGLTDQAIEYYLKLIELRPEDANAVFSLIRLWVDRKEYAKAEQYLAEKLQELKDSPQLFIALGIVYRESGEMGQALRAFERAAALNPNSAQTHFYLATQLDAAGHRESSRMHLKRVIELDPVHADALNYLGYMNAEEGVHLDEARILVEKALLIDPENGAYIDSLGWIYYQMGEYERAATFLEKAALLIDNDPTILIHLGEAYHKLNDEGRAREYWEKARQLGADAEIIKQKLEQLEPYQEKETEQ